MTTERWIIYIAVYSLMLLGAIMQWKKKLPSVKSFQDLTATVNSRGGNILLLAGFSALFFICSMWVGFWSMNKISEGKLTADNAVLGVVLNWLTGSAFGGSFGAMLKTMTGEGSTSRRNDVERVGDGVATVTSSLSFSGRSINAD